MDQMVESAIGYLSPIAAGALLFMVASYLMNPAGRRLQSRFVRLGPLEGRTKDEIIGAVGQPSSSWSVGYGKALLQWVAPGYHIALRFDGDRCEAVTYECRPEGEPPRVGEGKRGAASEPFSLVEPKHGG